MTEPLIFNLVLLVIQLSLPVVGATLVGGILGGIIQATLRIEDRSVSYAVKFALFLLVIGLSQNFLTSTCREFAIRIWGAQESYR